MSSSTTATGQPVAIQPGVPGFTAGFASLDAEVFARTDLFPVILMYPAP